MLYYGIVLGFFCNNSLTFRVFVLLSMHLLLRQTSQQYATTARMSKSLSDYDESNVDTRLVGAYYWHYNAPHCCMHRIPDFYCKAIGPSVNLAAIGLR